MSAPSQYKFSNHVKLFEDDFLAVPLPDLLSSTALGIILSCFISSSTVAAGVRLLVFEIPTADGATNVEISAHSGDNSSSELNSPAAENVQSIEDISGAEDTSEEDYTDTDSAKDHLTDSSKAADGIDDAAKWF
ncbi:hypothetical protein CANARDRAFT_10513 [[Candida] arabinofermentans NRRL YB-2248]|uniref:Uncharacterized protein n=1 Tax=[Candida] arabinofermentans NRRL YB-2248 TaxID=983967 RepID=A0A1E4SSX1_9ASCO|nr:hypothetical protein CANARDRAFT_10513 [[Candida] arabinofermentans NRRL YB-2248]